MSKGAKLMQVVYVDTQEVAEVLIGIGGTVRAADWAEKEYPYPPKPALKGLEPAEVDFEVNEYREAKYAVDALRENRAGLYAVYLGAQAGKLRGSELGWVDWLDLVTMPDADDDADEAEEPAEGESSGPSSEA